MHGFIKKVREFFAVLFGFRAIQQLKAHLENFVKVSFQERDKLREHIAFLQQRCFLLEQDIRELRTLDGTLVKEKLLAKRGQGKSPSGKSYPHSVPIPKGKDTQILTFLDAVETARLYEQNDYFIDRNKDVQYPQTVDEELEDEATEIRNRFVNLGLGMFIQDSETGEVKRLSDKFDECLFDKLDKHLDNLDNDLDKVATQVPKMGKSAPRRRTFYKSTKGRK